MSRVKIEIHEPPRVAIEETDTVVFSPEETKQARVRTLQEPTNFPMSLHWGGHKYTKLINSMEGWEISLLDTDFSPRHVHSHYFMVRAAIAFVAGTAKEISQLEYDLAEVKFNKQREKFN